MGGCRWLRPTLAGTGGVAEGSWPRRPPADRPRRWGDV